jgi:hypothetical protein
MFLLGSLMMIWCFQLFLASGNRKNLQSCKSHAKGVLKWYNCFYGRYPFVIAIQAKDRFPPDPWAHIGPAARDLGGLGFKVLVDASQDALADKETEREEYVDIEFMSKDLLFKIPEFQNMSGRYCGKSKSSSEIGECLELLQFPSLKELLKSFVYNRSIGTEEMPIF